MDRRGFTFTEMMVASIVIIILVSISIPVYTRILDRAKVMPQLTVLLSAINKLHAATGQWPHGDANRNVNTLADWKSGVAGLLMDDASNPYPFWNGPYLDAGNNPDRFFLDPWGNVIIYDGCPDTEGGPGDSSLMSYGPNGASDGSFNRPGRDAQGDDIVIYQT